MNKVFHDPILLCQRGNRLSYKIKRITFYHISELQQRLYSEHSLYTYYQKGNKQGKNKNQKNPKEDYL